MKKLMEVMAILLKKLKTKYLCVGKLDEVFMVS
jgi:hypothetical protein